VGEVSTRRTAFVLGGGGVLGAVEVGMLRALLEAGITPDLVVGTSIGALNGALLATEPGLGVIDRLEDLWRTAADTREIYGDNAVTQVRRAVRSRTHVYSAQPLRERLEEELGGACFEDLAVEFQCVASSIERAAEHWFSSGPVAPAVMASAAVPGFFPPAEIDGEHFLDGGIVNSVPVGHAVELGATEIYVLQVGRVDRPLTAPSNPLDVARVSFEIARRHRFHREMSRLPEGVRAWVLPTGSGSSRDDALTAFRSFGAIERRIEMSYAASAAFLRAREDA
jgi:NTE family protein